MDDVTTLARAPAWPLERTLALPGHCKGALLKQWGEHVRRRFGEGAADALRAEIGASAVELPDAPESDRWFPVAWQLALTRRIVDRHLGGDMLRLEPMLREDARRQPTRLVDRVARLALSPKRILGASDRIQAGLFDLGKAEAHVERTRATILWTGAPFFADPTWRVVQVFAVRAMFDHLRAKEPRIAGREIAADAFELVIDF